MNNSKSSQTSGTITGIVERCRASIVKELFFQNRSDFPDSGIKNAIYISLDENYVYRFDTEENVYKQLKMSIDSIQCKLREE